MINQQCTSEAHFSTSKSQADQKRKQKDLQNQSKLQIRSRNKINQQKIEQQQQPRQGQSYNIVSTHGDQQTQGQHYDSYQLETTSQVNPLNVRKLNKNNKAQICLLKICLFLFVFIILFGFFVLFVSYEQRKLIQSQSVKNGLNKFAIDGSITSVFVVNNQQDLAFQSLSSYLTSLQQFCLDTKDKLEFNDILIGYHKNFTQKHSKKLTQVQNNINKIISKPIKIRWIQNKNQQINMIFIDKLINLVSTQYFFFSTTQYVYQSQNQPRNKNSIKYLELSLSVLSSFPETSQLKFNENGFEQNNNEISFSFSPALHRTKDYHFLARGFQEVSGPKSTMSEAESKISEYYLGRFLYVMRTDKNFGILRKYPIIRQKKPGNKYQTIPDVKKPEVPKKPSQQQIVWGKYSQPKDIFQKSQRMLIKNSHFQNLESIIASLQKQELEQKNYFINKLHNAKHFYTFSQYLMHNRAFNVLTVNCNQICRERYDAEYRISNHINKNKFIAKHILHLSQLRSQLKNGQQPVTPLYDWITFQDLQLFFSSALQTQFLMQLYTTFGVSVVTDVLNIHPDVLFNILKHMKDKDFYYDQTKSLSLSRVLNKKVLIFIKGQFASRQKFRQKQGINYPKKNHVSIHTVFKIKQNIPFLRQWLIYHIQIGIDKFYLYDNSNSTISKADFRVTGTTNRFGMSLNCIDYAQDQVQLQWQIIWAQFYQHIIYCTWEPRNQDNMITYGQLQAQQDYIKNYKDVSKYTLFIDIDEMLFSPQDKNLQQFLKFYENNRVSSIKFIQRHFVNRFCQPNKKVMQIYHYFPSDPSKLHNMKIIAETNSFLPFQNISEGKATRGRQIVVPESQFRINHYNLQRNQFIYLRENKVLLGGKFEADNSILRYQEAINARCKGLCSDVFAIECPRGKIYANCLDVKQNYPFEPTKQPRNPQQQQTQPSQPVQPVRPVQPIQPVNPTPRRPPTPYSPVNIVSRALDQIESFLKTPRQIFQLKKLKQIKQLPICIMIIPSQKYSSSVLLESIRNQNYKNYITIEAPIQRDSSNNQSQQPSQNYYYFINRIKNQCKLNSLVVFARNPLLPSALAHLNQKHQTFVAYVSYSKSSTSIQVHSFFYRIYELLDKNDFNNKNKQYLKKNSVEVQCLGLLQISREYVIQIQKAKIMIDSELAYFSVLRDSKTQIQRNQYTGIFRLSQDMTGNVIAFNPTTIAKARIIPGSRMTPDHMHRAVERQQLWYLPQNHSIQQVQLAQLDQLYNISKYTDISRQVRFCVTILSHNNIQNDRYIKVLKSIIQQKYENYHIVFIDDNSTDNNMNGSIQYLKSVNFPKDRMKFIQNLQRNFATYNIINAGFNFCDENDVQMLMDGDDQFVGKYAFQVMNSAYQLEFQQNKQIWVAYSNYKSNFLTFGRSKGMNSDYQHMAGNRRSYISIFGPVRTWRVKVIYNIPLLHHKMQNGQWLDTVYDDALSHPLFQVSSARRVKYQPQVLSEYNMRYGDNDDSSSQKIKHRSDVYRYIISLTPLKPLGTLQGSIRDLQVMRELSADIDVRYTVLDV